MYIKRYIYYMLYMIYVYSNEGKLIMLTLSIHSIAVQQQRNTEL